MSFRGHPMNFVHPDSDSKFSECRGRKAWYSRTHACWSNAVDVQQSLRSGLAEEVDL